MLLMTGPQDNPEVFRELFVSLKWARGHACSSQSAYCHSYHCSTAPSNQPAGISGPDVGYCAAGQLYPRTTSPVLPCVGIQWDWSPVRLSQQLWDVCQWWLLSEECDADDIISWVVLEQFIIRLLEGVVTWVQYHRLVSVEEVVRLVEDHLVMFPEVGAPFLPLCLLTPPLSLYHESEGQFPRNPCPELVSLHPFLPLCQSCH